jgi:hypothetical protein
MLVTDYKTAGGLRKLTTVAETRKKRATVAESNN